MNYECLNLKNLNEMQFLSENDKELLERFLKQKTKVGLKDMRTYKSVLFLFFTQIKKSLLNITENDAEDYFECLDHKNLKYAYKQMTKAILNSFFKANEKRLRNINSTFYNPIPNDFKFTNDKAPNPKQQKQDLLDAVFSISELKEIILLSFFKSRDSENNTSKGYYILILLCIFTGARISEIVSIKKSDINVEERWFQTGTEDGARKSNPDNKKPLIFILHSAIALQLNEFMKENNSMWLFPGRGKYNSTENNETHIVEQTVNYFMKSLPIQIDAKRKRPHIFRNTLITFMMNTKNNVNKLDAELLTNHVPSGIVGKKYDYKSTDERRERYDACLPTEYLELIEYIRHL